MKYHDGRQVMLGDKVKLGDDREGVVVCSLDTNEFTPEFLPEQWAYLKHGVMINFLKYGLIHYVNAEPDLVLLERAK